MFYQYLQWQIGLQLQRAQRRARDHKMSIGLYHDLALATDRFGSDLWPTALLRRRLPGRLAARRFRPRGPGLGLSAAQLRSPPRRRLPPFRRNHPP